MVGSGCHPRRYRAPMHHTSLLPLFLQLCALPEGMSAHHMSRKGFRASLTLYPQTDRTLLGHLVKFLQEPWGFPLVRWQRTIPSTTHGFYRIFLGPSDYLVPMTPKALAVIMNDPNTFPKTAAVREGFIATLGNGVVSTVGAVHRVSHMFMNF